MGSLSLDRAWEHLHWLERHAPERISGTPDQERAGEYFVERLADAGLDARLDAFTGYRSVPLRGAFRLVSPVAVEYPCVACGHIVSTPDEGVDVPLVYLGPGAADDYAGRDVRGAAVLTEIATGPSRPDKARIAAAHGARVIVFINWGLPEFETIPCGAIKCVWGNPTRAMMDEIPQIAAVGISRAAGDAVLEMLTGGPVRAQIVAQATRDWGPMTQPWARIRAPNNHTGDYLVVGGHYDAWRPGMTDNAAGNALKLELARVFSSHRDALARDIVFGFWNGHEVGDYEGSTWFADRYWDDLDAHAVAYFNVDSVGFAHSESYLADSTPELEAFHRRIEREVLGTDGRHRHLTRANEHPFFGLGLPALEGRFHFSERQIAEWGGARGSWWWHSTADTIDKIDRDRFRDTARVYAAYAWEMCTAPVLPMDFRASASRITGAVVDMEELVNGRFSMELPLDPFVSAVDALHDAAHTSGADRTEEINRTIKKLSRLLLPAFETAGGRYAQDRYGLAALDSAVPALHGLELLATLPPEDDLVHQLHTELLRERNRLSDALRWATDAIQQCVG